MLTNKPRAETAPARVLAEERGRAPGGYRTAYAGAYEETITPTALFAQDFEAGAGSWTFPGGTWGRYWNGTDGYHYKQTDWEGIGESSAVIAPAVTYGEITATARVRLDLGQNVLAGLALRRDPANAPAYFVGIRNSDSAWYCGIYEKSGSTWTNRTPGLTACKYDAGSWHTLMVRAAGGRIEMHVDGALITTWVDTTPLPAQGFGLMTFDGAASFDDIKVYGLATRSYYLFGAARVGERVTHLAKSASAGDLYALHSDHLGSVSLATDAWGVTVTLSLARYFPFGAERGEAATGSPTDFRYATGRKAGFGLTQMGARWLDPNLGRWTSPDTVIPGMASPQGLDRYSYVSNRPLQYADPSGHCPFCLGAIVGAIGGGIVGMVMAAAPQAIENIQTGQPLAANIDPTAVLQGAAVGALTGAIGGATFGLGVGLVPTMLIGGASGVAEGQVEQAATNVLEGRTWTEGLLNPQDMAGDFLIGAAGAGVGHTVGRLLSGCSFSADTPVFTEDGLRPISTVIAGDLVLAYDEALGATALFTVTAVWVHEDPVIQYLVVNDERLLTTPDHLFYTSEIGWVPAGALWSGARIRTAAGTHGIVKWHLQSVRTLRMYNLTVAQAHTYFVGQQRWLVHNDCGKTASGAAKLLRQNMEADGRFGASGMAAHHIVPHNDVRARELRGLLTTNGIGLNESVNGAYVTPETHRLMSRFNYIKALQGRLGSLSGDELTNELAAIGLDIENRRFWWWVRPVGDAAEDLGL